MTASAKKKSRPRRRLIHALDKRLRALPVPTLGRFTPVMGVLGLLVATLAFGLVAATVLRLLVSSGELSPFIAEEGIPLPPSEATPNPEYAANLLGGGSDRTTILLMGADTRPAETGYRTPTDTIMLLMIDRENNQAGILSIPRDLYVDIPAYGLGRINTAYVKGGGETAMATVEYNLGVEVDHFMLVQFDAFTTLVDEIGGVDVYVPYTIDDATFPAECYDRSDCGYDPFYIDAGLHHMDGETALRYARTRHGDNDFERARRQQAVIMAVRERVTSFSMLPTLTQGAPNLYATLTDSIRTDMTLDDMVVLAALADEIPEENIRSGVIDMTIAEPTLSSKGEYILVADAVKLESLLRHVFWLDE